MASEIGFQSHELAGWTTFGSDETHETNPDLIWPLSTKVFDKMRREDAQVASVYRAVTLPLRRTAWVLDPEGASDEVSNFVATDLGLALKGRDVVAPVRTRGRFSWEEHLRLALLELVYGHSFFEQVYDIDAFGRAHLKKLAWRPPRTISKIDVASDGGLKAIEQGGLLSLTEAAVDVVRIPVDRLVAYVNDREGANWLGQSLLRPAYKNWLLKDRMLRAQALTVERNGLGVPVYTGAEVPASADGAEREKWLASEKDAGLKLAKGFRAGDAAGASIPHGATLDLKGVSGKLPDTDGPIRYHDEQIARAVLAHFLNLGTETGSWALGSTFANFFTDSLNAVAQQIADVAQQHIIEDLVDLNWGPNEPAPRLVPAAIGSEQAATAEAIKALVEAGALTADESIEAYARNAYGLPVKAATAPTDETTTPDADAARAAAETVQKVYLGVGPVMTRREARDLVRRAGAELNAADDAEPTPDTSAEEAA